MSILPPRVLFLAEQFSDAERTPGAGHPGGAELTDQAAIDVCPWPIECALSQNFDPRRLKDFDIHILGNLPNAKHELLSELNRLGRHIFFEHDLRICQWSGNFPNANEANHQQLNRCICPHPHLSSLYASALGTIFLTHRQLGVYRQNPFFKARRPIVLGSSLMNEDFFERADAHLKTPTPKDIEVAIVYSQNKIKGFEQARQYCEDAGIEPYIIKALPPTGVLDILARSKQFVFLPQGPEPAGRLPLEARFLGCEVITNNLTGVCGESWWNLPDAMALEVVRDAPHRFWRIVDHLRTASSKTPDQDTPPQPLRFGKFAAPLTNTLLSITQPLVLTGPILARATRTRQRFLKQAESVRVDSPDEDSL